MPYSPSRYAVHGSTRFSSRQIASTIWAAAAPGAYQADVPSSLTISPPPTARALDHRLDPVGGHELRQRHAADRRRRDDRHHLVAVAAEDERLDVLDRRLRLPGDEGRKRAVSRMPAWPKTRSLGKPGDVLGHVAHRVERVRDDDQDRVRRRGDRLLGDRLDDVLVRRDEVVAAHPRLARQAGRDHDDLGAGGLVVAVRPGDARLVAEDGGGLVDVERLALREALLDVDEDDVAVVAARELLRAGRADVPGADDRDLPTHERARPCARSGRRRPRSCPPRSGRRGWASCRR